MQAMYGDEDEGEYGGEEMEYGEEMMDENWKIRYWSIQYPKYKC